MFLYIIEEPILNQLLRVSKNHQLKETMFNKNFNNSSVNEVLHQYHTLQLISSNHIFQELLQHQQLLFNIYYCSQYKYEGNLERMGLHYVMSNQFPILY